MMDHLERLLFQKVGFFFSFHQSLLVLRFLHLTIINQSLLIIIAIIIIIITIVIIVIIIENPATCSLVILLFLKNLQIQNPTPPRTRAATFLILDLLQIRFLFFAHQQEEANDHRGWEDSLAWFIRIDINHQSSIFI